MNLKELKKYIKGSLATDVSFDIGIINKIVCFYLYGYDSRQVCSIEIPYNDRLDKRAIYTSIADLIKGFDFSFRVTFDNTKDIFNFLEMGGSNWRGIKWKEKSI